MKKIDNQIKTISTKINHSLSKIEEDGRQIVAQFLIGELRHLVEHIIVRLANKDEYTYDTYRLVESSHFIKTKGEYSYIRDFHQLLQKVVSHYVPEPEAAERLSLKYYEYLINIRNLLKEKFGLIILENLDLFPLNLDSSTRDYYEKIVDKINQKNNKRVKFEDRFYIIRKNPFFIGGSVYYEITYTIANQNASKFDRVIAFTKHDILTNYSVKLKILHDEIDLYGKKISIQIIEQWQVSIRPCELNSFSQIFNPAINKISSSNIEYNNLMDYLTYTKLNLLEVAISPDEIFNKFCKQIERDVSVLYFLENLIKARDIIFKKLPGHNILRYLLYNLNYKIIRNQLQSSNNNLLSNLRLNLGTKSFDEMPFTVSLIKHNPPINSLLYSLDTNEYEFLGRYIENNTEVNGVLYTPLTEIPFTDIDTLIEKYNSKIYKKHYNDRHITKYKDRFAYINKYEQDIIGIISKVKHYSNLRIPSHYNYTNTKLRDNQYNIDCEVKKEILLNLFNNSCVAFIYGAAGTGKTKIIEHISYIYSDQSKLFLTNTNPAINNLKSRIKYTNSKFKTISSFLHPSSNDIEYEILIIDECSTVSNKDLIMVLNRAKVKAIIFVGDIYQIESILFGSWFKICKELFKDKCTYELTENRRTKSNELIALWGKVRNLDNDISEYISKNNFSYKINELIFQSDSNDEIILCLNYDGVFGINNINRFLQKNNTNLENQWGVHTYKIGDPVLFTDNQIFNEYVHNNLKGVIVAIDRSDEKITFDILIDKVISEFEITPFSSIDLLHNEVPGKSKIRFSISKSGSSDDGDDSPETIVPFQIAYAISIHKAQGLEYGSVKIIITDETDELVSHNIFYTAITRSKDKLKIFWSPESQNKILNSFLQNPNKISRDIHILKQRYNL